MERRMKKKSAVAESGQSHSQAKGAVEGDRALPFAEGMAALEQIVEHLESGDLPLEEALEAFEKGVGLVRALNEKLTVAEQRVEILSRGKDGGLGLRAADEDEL